MLFFIPKCSFSLHQISFQEGEYKPIRTGSWLQEMNHHGLVEREKNQGACGEGEADPDCQPQSVHLAQGLGHPLLLNQEWIDGRAS